MWVVVGSLLAACHSATALHKIANVKLFWNFIGSFPFQPFIQLFKPLILLLQLLNSLLKLNNLGLIQLQIRLQLSLVHFVSLLLKLLKLLCFLNLSPVVVFFIGDQFKLLLLLVQQVLLLLHDSLHRVWLALGVLDFGFKPDNFFIIETLNTAD